MIICSQPTNKRNTNMNTARYILASVAAALFASCVAVAGTLYVDAGADAVAADGSRLHPYSTLQAAADAAGSGDTISVAAGTYSSGGADIATATGTVRCRLYVEKKLRFVAAEGKGTVHVVGGRDDGPDSSNGMGENAVRCVFVAGTSSADRGADTVFEGFVFRDGHTCCTNTTASGESTETPPNFGGGIYAESKFVYLVDCVVSNCTARYGGAMYGGTAIRTLFANNAAFSGVAMCKSAAVNCVFAGNSELAQTAVASDTDLCNCTLANNPASWVLDGSSKAYNTVALFSGSRMRYSDAISLENCVSYPEDANAAAIVPASKGPFQLVSSFADDWRPVSTGDAVGAGDASHLENVVVPAGSGIDVYVDYNGRSIAKSGAVQSGAAQDTVTPAGGALFFSGESHLSLDGRPMGRNAWVFPETYPTQYAFKAAVGEGESFHRIARLAPSTGNENFSSYPSIYPQLKDDVMYMMPSPDVSAVHTNVSKLATQIFWTDPAADASVADGSEARPFRTLQAAFNAASDATTSNTLVRVKAGTYAEGATTNSTYGIFRLFAYANKDVFFRAEEGPGTTFLVGAPDAEVVGGDFPGCGPNAVSTVLCSDNRSLAFRGFTFKDAYTCGADETSNNKKLGALVSRSGCPQALDCVFTNIVSTRACTCNVLLKRCTFSSNRSAFTICYGSTLASCYFGSNSVINANNTPNGYLAGSSVAYNCTLIGTPRYGRVSGGPANYYNCIVDGGNSIYSQSGAVNYYRSIVHNYANNTSNPTDWRDLDPIFVDRDRDGTLRGDSPALTLSYVPTTENYGADYFKYATSDVNGAPILFTAGVPAIGAFQVPLWIAVVTVADPGAAGGFSVTTGSVGENMLYEGDEVVISLAAGTRPCAGVTVNGVEFRFDESEYPDHTIHITFDDVKAAGGTLSVEGGIYTSDWYVDDDGDDANTGFTRFDAKRTLATAAAGISSGDTLWALPGVYDYGDALHNNSRFIRSRVVVNGDTSVVSTDGPGETFIIGAQSDDPDGYGCGTNAIRCAALSGKGARLSGFTLTGGRTYHSSTGAHEEDYSGGAVLGTSNYGRDFALGMIVDNCVISNSAALNGGVCRGVQLVGCVVVTNRTAGSLVHHASAFGSYFDGNTFGGHMFNYCENICGSIVSSGNATSGGGWIISSPGAHSRNSKERIYNSLFCPYVKIGSGNVELRNSVFTGNSTFAATCDTNETVKCVSSDLLALNTDGSPVIGVNPAVDAADLSLYDFDFSDATYAADELAYVEKSVAVIKEYCGGVKDIRGLPRVQNASADIGCFEADWSDRYAAIIGGDCWLSHACSNAFAEVGGTRVTLHAGEPMAISWIPRRGISHSQGYMMYFRVTGSGSLRVVVNGVLVATLTAADGERTVAFEASLPVNEMRVSYEPGANDDGGAEMWGLRRNTGVILIWR